MAGPTITELVGSSNVGDDRTTLNDNFSNLALTADTQVNLTNALSATEIQALIDAQPKNLNGYELTFQFADGTYALNAALIFKGFHGGVTYIYGNSADSSLGTSKSVILNFTGDVSGIEVGPCAHTHVMYFEITVETDVTGTRCIVIWDTPSEVRYNSCAGNSTGNGTCFGFFGGNSKLRQNYMSNTLYGVFASYARVASRDNDDTGTQPAYGLYSTDASTIGKAGTQPTGSTSSETAGSGGVIRA